MRPPGKPYTRYCRCGNTQEWVRAHGEKREGGPVFAGYNPETGQVGVMTIICWLALNPRRALPVLAAMAVPACVLVGRRVVRR